MPTIYGKTVVLQPGNFFTASADVNLDMEILRASPQGIGTGVISGTVTSSADNPTGRMRQLQTTFPSTSSLPIVLMSSDRQPIQICYTDATGYYEFKNLPRGNYEILICSELDTRIFDYPMPLAKIDTQDFRKHFGERVFFSDNDIRQYLLRRTTHLNESTLRWHIHQRKESHTLRRVKRGVYTLSRKPVFRAQLDKEIRQVYQEVTGAFSPDLPCIVWSTESLHQFMVLQPTQHFVIFETEKEWMDPLFQQLRDAGQSAFLNPSREMLERYILGRSEAFIVKPLTSRAPIQHGDDVETPALEKILVDLIIDTDLFLTYQGSELENIFQQAWKNYFLNLSVLLNYARRRRHVDKLLDFVSNLSDPELHKVLSK